MKIDRRDFVKGIAYAVVASGLAAGRAPAAAMAELPRIELRVPNPNGWFTAEYLWRVLRDIHEQVAGLSGVPLLPGQYEEIVRQVEGCLDRIRPAALIVDVDVTGEELIAGRFAIAAESDIVQIRGVARRQQ